MTYQISIAGSDVVFPAEPGEKILSAAEKAGIDLPHACRGGFCGACRAKVVSGDFIVYAPGSKEGVLTKSPDSVLTCVSEAASDAVLDVKFTRLNPNIRMKIERMFKVAPDVMVLHLAPENGKPLEFTAGQFIDFILEKGERRSYSIASDSNSSFVELHIRYVKGGLFTERLFNGGVQAGDVLEVAAPSGDFRLHKRTENDLVFFVTGTGFAPAKAMIENFIRIPSAKPHQVYLYWGGRHTPDLYMDMLCRGWEEKNPWFHYCPVLSRADETDAWTGRTGHVQDAFLAEHPDASEFDVYICGTPRLVIDTAAALTAAGTDASRIYSDSFTSKADAK